MIYPMIENQELTILNAFCHHWLGGFFHFGKLQPESTANWPFRAQLVDHYLMCAVIYFLLSYVSYGYYVLFFVYVWFVWFPKAYNSSFFAGPKALLAVNRRAHRYVIRSSRSGSRSGAADRPIAYKMCRCYAGKYSTAS